ncbi:hypothetical protein C8E05_5165 [Rhodococcus wratislaviensis]|nr:hypothetical protein C8E05_5165 [Rhodococcus wratislaviensis]
MRVRRAFPPVRFYSVSTVSAVVIALAVATFGANGVVGAAEAGADPVGTPDSSSVAAPPEECVGSTFATLGNIYDAVFDSLLPTLPAEVQQNAGSIKTDAHRDMDGLRVSSLAVSNHPRALGASADSPSLEYRDPLSGYVLTQLMNIRNGTAYEAITVDDMTLSQAVETAYLYLYVTVIIPMTMVAGTIPAIMPIGPVSLGLLISLPLRIGAKGMDLVVEALSNELVDACLVSVTQEEKDRAGQPVKDLRFPNHVPQMLEEIADQVLIAEDETCPAVGTLPLSRVVDRTAGYLADINTDPAVDQQIADQAARLQDFMKTAQVPHNLIPSDPADFTTIETLMSLGLGLVPYVGGAPTEAIIGLTHSYFGGADMSETVPLSDLTVTKSMTAGYYAYALSAHVFEVAYGQSEGLTVSLLQMLLPTLSPEQLAQSVPQSDGLINAPNTYGLVVFHNVLRSVCLAKDKVDQPAG